MKTTKPVCLVASYGGSGSTFLTKALGNLPKAPYLIQHVHGVPEPDFLGIPVFNLYTGHSEGPFSKQFEMPLNAKVIVIYRDPAEAYRSRASFKHFMHIWSETDRQTRVFGEEPPNVESFQKAWKADKASGEDIMGLADYMDRWHVYARGGRHDICFVKYEALRNHWQDLLDFLGVKEASPSAIEDFHPKQREIGEELAQGYRALRASMAEWPGFEVYPAAADQDPNPRRSDPTRTLDLLNSSFTGTKINAGATDAISRLSVIYDVMTSFFNIDFRLPKYRNYHSPDLDFFQIFGLYDQFPSDSQDSSDRSQVGIRMSEMIYYLLYDDTKISDHTDYFIQANVYQNDFRVQRLDRFRGLTRKFLKQLTYTPSHQVFSGSSDTRKAVVHLRRQDICGGVLFDGPEAEEVPEHRRRGIHVRPLLTLERAVRTLENNFPDGSTVELIVVSDGVGRLRRNFARFPGLAKKIDSIEAELYDHVRSHTLDIRVVERIIGTGQDETLRTLDAMHQADLVVTASSTFPRLPCTIGNTKLISEKLA